MDPLDIRIVRFLEAIEKSGIDPKSEDVKRAIKQMLITSASADVPPAWSEETKRIFANSHASSFGVTLTENLRDFAGIPCPVNNLSFKVGDRVTWYDEELCTESCQLTGMIRGLLFTSSKNPMAIINPEQFKGIQIVRSFKILKIISANETHWQPYPQPNHTITSKKGWSLGQKIWYYCPFAKSLIFGTIGAFTNTDLVIIWTDPTSIEISTARRTRIDDLHCDDGNIMPRIDLQDSAGFSKGDRVCWEYNSDIKGTIVGFCADDETGGWLAILFSDCTGRILANYVAVSELVKINH
ncbi:MAG TPA: hypothetical protein V6D27_01060 [Vampirovibrionales bacterium]